LSYSETLRFSKIFLDYIDGKSALKPFYNYSPDLAGIRNAIDDRAKIQVNRVLLQNVLHDQYSRILSESDVNSGKILASIDSLAQENTFTVTTGQQTGIFLGPLYTLLKAITVINLSRTLKKAFPEFNFVPVFWLASEDHDKEEINHLDINSERIVWNTEQHGAVGRFSTDGLVALSESIINKLGIGKYEKELEGLLKQAYQRNSLADATALLLHRLLGKDGLVIINPDDALLKQSFVPIMQNEIKFQKSIDALNLTSESLSVQYKTQINGRPINLFYLTNDERSLINADVNGKYSSLDGLKKWTERELLKEIGQHPEKFSPNVVLRPVYQEQILPNIAYIGGAAEVAYWLQLKGVFEAHQLFFPVIIPRNSAAFISSNTVRIIEKTGLPIADFFKNKDVLIRELITSKYGKAITLDDEHKMLDELFNALSSRAQNIDPTLGASAIAFHKRMKKQMSQFSDKMLRAVKRKQDVDFKRIMNVMDTIFPSGKLQERRDTILPYYLEYGDAFIQLLLEELKPLDFRFSIIHL
jgi:bacillithiol biosynthesis cysteine-adding enzyme BshC